MRLFLLPVSTRRTLIYCERVQQQLVPGQKLPISERVISRASETWAQWERETKGWKKKITVYGNQMFKRIPFEEWGLKSIPPATKKRLEDVEAGRLRFDCLYPAAFVDGSRVLDILQRLATERQALHRKKMWSSVLWMPITIPFTVVPVIPNIPFFYLCFRAYSHYRALYGGRLLEQLLAKKLVTAKDSSQMDTMYTVGLLHPTQQASREASPPTETDTAKVKQIVGEQSREGAEEVMLLQKWNGVLIAEEFQLPEMEIEIERAVEQVELAIKKDHRELKEEKEEVMKATDEARNPRAKGD